MIVCLCNRVSDRDVKAAIRNGAQSVSDVAKACNAGTDCGACCCEIRDMLRAKKSTGSLLLGASVLAPALGR